ncbi:sugar kinase [Anaerolinea sp.]|uniref:carbohydrate kinase family protein n=1 Tax=Anaerolinea sp. TaxID=1872519 RepID=UPI002ACE3F81|nr:sugar kinase [Anaerolinea sp.]
MEELGLVAVGEILVDLIGTESAENLDATECFCRFQGGSPANLAVNVARLGGRSALIACVGNDAFGRFLERHVAQSGVDVRWLRHEEQAPTSLVFVSRTSGTPDFQPYRGADFRITARDIPDEVIRAAQVVHITTWPLSMEPSRSAVLSAIQRAKAWGKAVSFDPNFSPKVWANHSQALEVIREVYRSVTLTKASLVDCHRLFGEGETPAEYIRRFHDWGAEIVVFTMGEQGSLLSQRGHPALRLPVRPVQVVDATGAGDAFWAGFLTAWMDGKSPRECLLFAREVVEIKLKTVGPLREGLNRWEIYARMPQPDEEFMPWHGS